MKTARLVTLLASALLSAALLAPTSTAADTVPEVVVEVEGRLERAVLDRGHTAEDSTALVTENGDRVALVEDSVAELPTGSTLTAEAPLTEAVTDTLAGEGVRLRDGQVLAAHSHAADVAVEELASAGDPVALDVTEATSPEPGQVANAAVATQRRMFVIGVSNVPGGSLEPDLAALRGHAERTAAYWTSQSNGALGFAEPVVKRAALTGTVPSVTAGCGFSDHTTTTRILAAAEAQFPGVDFFGESGHHLVIVLPNECSRAGVGMGSIGPSLSADGWSLVSASDPLGQVLIHELGHNFGLGHANLQQCGTSCRTVEYLDTYSPMGLSVCADSSCEDGIVTDGFTAPALGTSHQHFLDAEDNSLEVLSEVRRVELTARGAAGASGIEFNVPWSDRTYVVEWRDGAGTDAGSYYAKRGASSALSGTRHRPGVTFGFHGAGLPGYATTLFAEPTGASAWTGAMTAGASMTRDGVRVTVESVSGSAATVRIEPVPAMGASTPVVKDAKVGLEAKATLGGWPTGAKLAYEWTVAGAKVATTAGFRPRTSDVGKALQLKVTAKPAAGAVWPAFTKSSTAVKVVAGTLKAPVPKVTGTVKVARTVSASRGTWTSGTSFSYQWYANGSAISKATKSSYKIASKYRGAKLSVKVTGRKAGYATVSKTSAKTTAVKR